MTWRNHLVNVGPDAVRPPVGTKAVAACGRLVRILSDAQRHRRRKRPPCRDCWDFLVTEHHDLVNAHNALLDDHGDACERLSIILHAATPDGAVIVPGRTPDA